MNYKGRRSSERDAGNLAKQREKRLNDGAEMLCCDAENETKYQKKYLKYTVEFLLAFLAGILVRHFLQP